VYWDNKYYHIRSPVLVVQCLLNNYKWTKTKNLKNLGCGHCGMWLTYDQQWWVAFCQPLCQFCANKSSKCEKLLFFRFPSDPERHYNICHLYFGAISTTTTPNPTSVVPSVPTMTFQGTVYRDHVSTFSAMTSVAVYAKENFATYLSWSRTNKRTPSTKCSA